MTLTIRSKTLAALVVAIMFGGIFFSSAMGWWQTESTKEAALFTTGEFAGQANPADIRGSYTFGDVENNFGVTAAVLVQAFGVETDDPSAYQVKSLEEMYAGSPQEVGTASVRLFVAFYLGLPMDLSTDMWLPETAAAILYEHGLTAEQTAYVDAHTVPNLPAAPEAPAPEVTPQPGLEPTATATPAAEHVPQSETERMIKGKTTFAELLEWGVSPEAIEQVLGMSMPPAPGMTVKDFCSANGLSFETVKTGLQALVDALE